MKVIFGLGHPAHFHLFRNTFEALRRNNIEFKIVIQQKDILEQLLDINQYAYEIIFSQENRKNLGKKLSGYFFSVLRLRKIAIEFRPDLMIGSISQIAHAGSMLGIKSVFTAEDDFSYTWLQGIITYPFITRILSPAPTDVGPFKRKKLSYQGYHKLAYLHPDQFTPKKDLLGEHQANTPFFLIRLVNFQAYHDLHKKGLSLNDLKQMISLLEKFGSVYISSEGELDQELRKYELKINPMHVHHYMYYASLFIGDSQSMAVESALLGTPSIRINSFYNKINVLKELEFKYKLTFSYPPDKIEEVLKAIPGILKTPTETFKKRREKMLSEKINVTQFFSWFIINFPESLAILQKDPDYQNRFK